MLLPFYVFVHAKLCNYLMKIKHITEKKENSVKN